MDEGRSADLDNEAYWLTSWMAAYEDASLAADLFVSNYNLHTTPSWPVYPIMEEPVDEAALAAEFDDNETATQPIVFGSVDESAAVDTTRPRAMTSPIQLGEHIVFGNFAAEGNMPGDHGDASTPTAITGLTADSDAFGAQPEAPEADPAPVENWSCLGDTSLMKCEVYSQQRQAMQIMLRKPHSYSLTVTVLVQVKFYPQQVCSEILSFTNLSKNISWTLISSKHQSLLSKIDCVLCFDSLS